MCGRLDYYLDAFSSLKTSKNRLHWPEATLHRAPHQPLLLLSVLDEIGSGATLRNFIPPTQELEETFAGYWQKVMPGSTRPSMASAFLRLSSSSFWGLVERPGESRQEKQPIHSVKRLRKFYLGAKFNEDLYPLLVMQTSREKLRSAILEAYFSPKGEKHLLGHRSK